MLLFYAFSSRFRKTAVFSGLFRKLSVACFFLCCISYAAAQSPQVFTSPGMTTWTVPAGVTSITIETWGGGGGGGGAKTNASTVAAAAGGGGGGYARTTISVQPGETYNIEVGGGGIAGIGSTPLAGGTGGQSSVSFGGSSILYATGGVGGAASGAGSTLAGGGAGGAGVVNTGTASITYNGGSGSGGRTNGSNGIVGGAGGGGAGTGASGSAGEAPPGTGKSSALVGGNGGATGGGRGGNGGWCTESGVTGAAGQVGANGATIGGGAGGAVQKRGNTNRDGGTGARGEVRITYTVATCNTPSQPAAITGSASLCNGASGSYTVPNDPSATSYTWTLPSGWSGTSASNTITAIAGSSGGVITVTANNSCGASTAQTFTVTPGASPAQPAAITGSAILCSGASGTYTVPNDPSATGYTWTLPSGWNGSSTTNSISATAGAAGGTITVTANSTCGSSTAQTFAVSVGAPTSSSITDVFCDTYTVNSQTYTSAGTYTQQLTNAAGCDSTITIHLVSASAGSSMYRVACNSYTWNTQTYTQSGTYTQQFTNSGGCDSTVTLYLTINQLDMSVTQNGHILTANESNASYQWLNCDNGYAVVVGAVGSTFTATANGNYAVAISKNACTDTSACVQVLSASVDELDFTSLFTVYPNPGTGVYTLSSTQWLRELHIRIYSLTGQVVYSQHALSGQTVQLDISTQQTGIYVMEITSGDRRGYIRLIKQ